LICIVIIISLLAYLTIKTNSHSPLGFITASSKYDSLQLKTFYPNQKPTPTLKVGVTSVPTTPSGTCGIAGPISFSTTTNPNTGKCCVVDGAAESAGDCCENHYANYPNGSTTLSINRPFVWCDEKPVIYLYPEYKIDVSVNLNIPGIVTKSIPDIDKTSWKNLTAYPDGHFIYKDKTYNELFYETSETKSEAPKNGIVVDKNDVKSILTNITDKLGLLPSEQSEFLAYWLPKVNSIPSERVLISIFSPSQKDKIDGVTINPKPDVFINFIMYFKGVDNDYRTEPLTLPSEPPARHGFTAVEWGGIMDSN